MTRGSSKTTGGPYRKPRADFYTVALVLALIAILLAILCLWLVMGVYDKQIRGGPVPNFSPQARAAERTVARAAASPDRFGRPWSSARDLVA